ncbi:MAG TPA: hypothetical protein VN654_03910 [Vicinamibacterales bacterium]|nr:hypothetical protein [Vicinamibacterales bacterium]
MTTFARRLAALTAALTLCLGHLSVCAGWQASAAARMACCEDESTCPMHKADTRGSTPRHQLTQVQADTCCAATSNRTQASVTGTTFVLSNAIALPTLVGPVVPAPVLALQEWRALAPLPVSPVPKHLLLSVLLV